MTNLEALTMTDAEFLTKYAHFICNGQRRDSAPYTSTNTTPLDVYEWVECWVGSINQVPAGQPAYTTGKYHAAVADTAGPGALCWIKGCTNAAYHSQEHKRADGTTEVLNFCSQHYYSVPKDMVLDQ